MAKLLVIGGTRFIGKHLVLEAVSRGHEVTLFNRGSKPAPAGVKESVVGDRDHDLEELAGGEWDAVVDTSAYVPRQVREAARFFEPRACSYLFVSTISVYEDTSVPLVDEKSRLIRLPPGTDLGEADPANYGGLKALCEEELAAAYPPERSLIVRPTIVVGPDDPTDRFTYWPARVARGGEVLAPSGPGQPLQWIDVRDLAAWMVAALESGLSGTFNAVSEEGRFDMGSLLAACTQVTSSGAEVVWVEDEFLLERGVRPFADLPFWLPAPESNLFRIDGSRALAHGLKVRPAHDTVRATLEWHAGRGAPELTRFLQPSRERELLGAWAARGPRGGAG